MQLDDALEKSPIKAKQNEPLINFTNTRISYDVTAQVYQDNQTKN